ncbi:MAG TPA: phosphatase PAP2/dual specificity phosphatase family protein [Methylocystis sp.]|nr:phosphatase PAP2/dual specificity phosphatase family protein [Methylocystis sp.]
MQARPLGRAVLWLLCLGTLFFASYIAALDVAAARANVPTIVFGWERHIPFLPWTIVPYWSIDLFYGLSLLLCSTRTELKTHALRLLTAQLVAIPIFIAFPLKLAWTAPPTDGFFGLFFSALDQAVGKPFNLAPSLHIALLTILWSFYVRHVPRRLHAILHVWCALIGVSTLTTFQHHFFDLPTGALLGFFCLWLWPDGGGTPVAKAAFAREAKRQRLALDYAVGAALGTTLAVSLWDAWLWLLWPAVSLGFVACAYAFLGSGMFQKDARGAMSLAARALLAPYLLGARVNAFLWTRNLPASVEIADGVRLGRLPSQVEPGLAVIDLAAELPASRDAAEWRAWPMLDLASPDPALLAEVARAIESARRRRGVVLVCCALGFSRSAAAVAVWLASTGRAADAEDAVRQVLRARPQAVVQPACRAAIERAAQIFESEAA